MGFGTNSLTTYGNRTFSEIENLTGMKMGDSVYNETDNEIMHFTGTLSVSTVGNPASTSDTNLLPTNMEDDYSWSAMILEPAELEGSGGTITGIQFLGGNSVQAVVRTNQKMFIGHVSAGTGSFPSVGVLENVETYSFVSDYTQVFDGTITWNGGMWNTITFQTDFNWNGTDGIIIKFEDRDGSGTGTNNDVFFTYSSKVNACAYNSSNTSYPAAPTNGVRTSIRPVMRVFQGGANNSVGDGTGFDLGIFSMSKGSIAKVDGEILEEALLGNAIESPEDGAVTLHLESESPEKAIFVNYWERLNGDAVLCIQSGIFNCVTGAITTKANYAKPDESTNKDGMVENSGTSGASGDVGILATNGNSGTKQKVAWSFTERL